MLRYGTKQKYKSHQIEPKNSKFTMFSLQNTVPHFLCECSCFLAELQQAHSIITELCLRNSFLAGHLKSVVCR